MGSFQRGSNSVRASRCASKDCCSSFEGGAEHGSGCDISCDLFCNDFGGIFAAILDSGAGGRSAIGRGS
jgi:hypothetical protein